MLSSSTAHDAPLHSTPHLAPLSSNTFSTLLSSHLLSSPLLAAVVNNLLFPRSPTRTIHIAAPEAQPPHLLLQLHRKSASPTGQVSRVSLPRFSYEAMLPITYISQSQQSTPTNICSRISDPLPNRTEPNFSSSLCPNS